MAGWNNTPFLQALGWAIVNNVGQMAFLWLCFLVLQQTAPLSSVKKYAFLVAGIFLGFGWFLFTFYSYFFHPAPLPFFEGFSFSAGSPLFPLFLSSASIAYLVLLLFPAVRLVINWLFIKKIRAHQLEKSNWMNRLFVEKTRLQLGIKKRVPVYCSKLVHSPVTIGFIKPLILLPFSIFTHLSPQQTEAILLHELAHIRRSDYIINLLLSVIHVVLYFNPFLNLFLKRIEQERENCCDEMVLQFGYDKVSYASALLELERRSDKVELAMAANNRKYLLRRIENIVGIKRSSSLKPVQLLPVFAGLLMLLFTQLMQYKPVENRAASTDESLRPLPTFTSEIFELTNQKGFKKGIFQPAALASIAPKKKILLKGKDSIKNNPAEKETTTFKEVAVNHINVSAFTNVAFNLADAHLNEQEKEQVKETIERTKKVLTLQWKEVDKTIGDAMTEAEKQLAKKDYLKKVEAADWRRLENTLKTGFEEIDWDRVTASLNEVITSAKLDSLDATYSKALAEIEKINAAAVSEQLLVPDVSEQQLQTLKSHLKEALSQIKALRSKKVIHL